MPKLVEQEPHLYLRWKYLKISICLKPTRMAFNLFWNYAVARQLLISVRFHFTRKQDDATSACLPYTRHLEIHTMSTNANYARNEKRWRNAEVRVNSTGARWKHFYSLSIHTGASAGFHASLYFQLYWGKLSHWHYLNV